MAEWNSNPQWNDLESINGGFNFKSFSDISASDFNKLVENMQFLYTNYLNSEGGELDMKRIYPVGSIYLSLEETFHPAEAFGGTWQKLTDRFLVGAGSAYSGGATGGETSHSHNGGSLTALMSEDGDNTNIYHVATRNHYNNDGVYASWNSTRALTLAGSSGTTTYRWQGLIVDGKTGTTTTLPPYLAVYMWKRTA